MLILGLFPSRQAFVTFAGGQPLAPRMRLDCADTNPSRPLQFSSLPSSRSSWGGPGATLLATSPSRSLSLSPRPERSVQSLEDEIMSLQKVSDRLAHVVIVKRR